MVLIINGYFITLVLFLIIIFFNSCTISTLGQLQVRFYSATCPSAEAIVHNIVTEAIASNQNVAPILLRLHFHDCFVQGCDGSILIDTGSSSDEKRAGGHQGVQGFDVVDRVKEQLEAVCPGTVSCADIVALAARDAIVMARGPFYEVETGRRDGLVSNQELAANMPEVGDNVQTLKAKFFEKGLSEKDLVVLSAAHTIGTTACFFMTQRLYNFPARGGFDPSINPVFLPELKATCPKNGDINIRLPMDRGSGRTFDNGILQNIRNGFAVLQSDATLYQDDATRRVIDSYFGMFNPFFGPSFEADFATSMIRMGRIGVLTGSQGTIRRVCSAFN